ncbi:polysaccharide biosynthesis protein [Deinococcus aerius]|uniref:Polysaccharide biosynthesis protein n=1 Tax=Deinococcus aerius TaxID=200253 RepID=A0A2I9D687_9DEIO|nr:lipopolysaccharide biosynthesis protein [Deinococcus aerius]GBF06216.1 polysaccharide biosynthesis protein [Deinococcus aerius]
MNNLRQKTMNALKWSYLGLFTNMLLQPLFMAVLARLLTPQEFGVAAIASTLSTFGALLTELGVGQAIVQRRDLTQEHIRAGFTASLVLSVVVTVVVWFAAPLAGAYTQKPEVVPVFRGFALTYVVAALSAVSTSLLRRELRFKPLIVGEVAAYVIGHGLLGIGAARLGFGAMSLVISAAATWVIQLGVSYAYARHPFALTFRWAPYRDLYSYGARMSALRLLEFFSGNVATFLMARLFDVTAVGLYNRAYVIAGMPVARLAGGLTRVLGASFAALQDDPVKLRRAYSSGLLAMSTVMFSLAAGLFVCAPEIVRVLLGDRYMAAVPLVQAFAVYVPFPVLGNIAAIVAEATARLNIKIAVQSVQLVFLAAAFWTVYRLGWGVQGFAWVLVVAGVLYSAAYAVVASRILGGGHRETLKAYAVGAGCGVMVGAPLFLVAQLLRTAGVSVFALFGVELLLGAVLLGLVVLLGPETELRRYALKFLRPITTRLAVR